ncbi:MAG: sulfotransferase family protein, partial [Chloroflexota bacterium]
WLAAWEERAFEDSDEYHKIRLREPDEDELNLLPIFSAIHLVFPFPFLEEFAPYVNFDTRLPPAERERFMAFYRRTMQRTLDHYGPGKHFLSKSPANSGRVDSLRETFPDARFITTTRAPSEVLPSTMSLFSFQWGTFSDLLEDYPFGDYMVEMTRHLYEYPLRRLEQGPDGRMVVVTFGDLVGDLGQTISDVYDGLGLDMGPRYPEALKAEVEKARRYESQHEYSLEEMGFTHERIKAEYQDVLDRFDFDRG